MSSTSIHFLGDPISYTYSTSSLFQLEFPSFRGPFFRHSRFRAPEARFCSGLDSLMEKEFSCFKAAPLLLIAPQALPHARGGPNSESRTWETLDLHPFSPLACSLLHFLATGSWVLSSKRSFEFRSQNSIKSSPALRHFLGWVGFGLCFPRFSSLSGQISF